MAVKPKLAMLPSGYKASKVYSVLPSDGVGDFDFSRSGEATRINKDGLIETVASNVPRLNYPLIDGVVSGCPSLLLEPARTNYVTYSNNFLDSSWLPTDLIVSSGVISPDGTANAFTISNTAASGIIQKAVSITGTRIVSIFAKKGTHRYLRLGAYGGTSSYANFDLENGVVADGANAIIENYGNGWFRCTCHSVDGTTGGVQIFPTNRSVGAATTNGSIHIYGVHLQQESIGVVNPTSYIPTTSTAVTRSAETCNNAGDVNTFNDSEGVLMAEISALDNLVDGDWISINDGGINNRILIGYSGANAIRFILISGSVFQVDFSKTIASRTSFNKVAFKWGLNDCSFWINGIRVDTDISATMPVGLVQLSFNDGATANFKGNTKQIQYFDTALTDTDLEQLTSWTSFNEMATAQQYSIL